MATITKPLRNHHITYRWAYPAKLLITKEGKAFYINSVEEGIQLLREWNILETDEDHPTASFSPRPRSPNWPPDTND